MRVLLCALAVLAVLPLSRGWFHASDHACHFHCARGGGCGAGKAAELSRLRRCENFLYDHRFSGRGPRPCRPPRFTGDRAFARRFFPLRVCRQEIACIARARGTTPRSAAAALMLSVLRVRAQGNKLRDELRFSRDPAYVRAVDEMTELRTRAELLAYVAAGGEVDAKSRFGNPIYRRVAAYLKENVGMRRLLDRGRVERKRRERDLKRRRYLNVVRSKFNAVMAVRSRLRGKRHARQVHEWLKRIKMYARRIDMMQDEAIEVRFYRSEYGEVKKEVEKHQREVNALRGRVAGLRRERVVVRARLAKDKKRLVDAVRELAKQVIETQDRNCPVVK